MFNQSHNYSVYQQEIKRFTKIQFVARESITTSIFRETKADLAGILNLIQEIAHLFIFIADILQLYSALFN